MAEALSGAGRTGAWWAMNSLPRLTGCRRSGFAGDGCPSAGFGSTVLSPSATGGGSASAGQPVDAAGRVGRAVGAR